MIDLIIILGAVFVTATILWVIQGLLIAGTIGMVLGSFQSRKKK